MRLEEEGVDPTMAMVELLPALAREDQLPTPGDQPQHCPPKLPPNYPPNYPQTARQGLGFGPKPSPDPGPTPRPGQLASTYFYWVVCWVAVVAGQFRPSTILAASSQQRESADRIDCRPGGEAAVLYTDRIQTGIIQKHWHHTDW